MLRNDLKDMLRVGIILLAGIVLASAVMIGVAALPVDRIRENLAADAYALPEEGTYPMLVRGSHASILDNFTDAVILGEAAFQGEQSLIDRAMNVYHTSWEGADPAESLVMVCSGTEGGQAAAYTRYWHGYLVLLKPLFMVFSYAQVRLLNAACQLLVVLLAMALLRRRGLGRYAAALAFAYLALYPPALGMSLQFSPCFYVSFLGTCAVLAAPEDSDCFRFRLIFLLTGMAVAFFDFLTYPLATWGLPMTAYLLRQRQRGWPMYRELALLSAFWCVGYGGMWFGKWCAAALLTGENSFEQAFAAVANRTSHIAYEEKIGLLDIYARQLWPMWENTGLMVTGLAAAAVYAVRGMRRGLRPLVHMPELVPLAGVMLAPFVWYTVAGNHSYVHFGFTSRALCMTVFAGLCLLIRWGERDEPAP